MTYCLDTNAVIAFFKGRGGVAQRLLALPPARVALPAVVVYELLVGVRRAAHPQRMGDQLRAFLEPVRVIDFGLAEAEAAADIRCALEAQGQPIGPHDLLIAATALANNCTLVTHNTREFGRVPGLPIQDWQEAAQPGA